MESPASSQPASLPQSKGRSTRPGQRLDPCAQFVPGLRTPTSVYLTRARPVSRQHPGLEPLLLRAPVLLWDLTWTPTLGLGTAPRPKLRIGSRSGYPSPGQARNLTLSSSSGLSCTLDRDSPSLGPSAGPIWNLLWSCPRAPFHSQVPGLHPGWDLADFPSRPRQRSRAAELTVAPAPSHVGTPVALQLRTLSSSPPALSVLCRPHIVPSVAGLHPLLQPCPWGISPGLLPRPDARPPLSIGSSLS